MTLSYWHSYRTLDFSAPLDGFQRSNYADMFEYISRNTEENSAIIFDKPRTLALYTQRRVSAIDESRKGDDLVAYMRLIGARYILFYDPWHEGVPREEYVYDNLRNHAHEFEPIHDSGDFVLYKIKS